MSLCGFLTCPPDLVTIGECSAFPSGRSAVPFVLVLAVSVVGDDGLMGTSAHGELKEGSCSC